MTENRRGNAVWDGRLGGGGSGGVGDGDCGLAGDEDECGGDDGNAPEFAGAAVLRHSLDDALHDVQMSLNGWRVRMKDGFLGHVGFRIGGPIASRGRRGRICFS